MGRSAMSYVRFSPISDVYVYADVGGWFACMWPDGEMFRTTKRSEMLAHLTALQADGLKIPSYVFERLEHELAQGFDEYGDDQFTEAGQEILEKLRGLIDEEFAS